MSMPKMNKAKLQRLIPEATQKLQARLEKDAANSMSNPNRITKKKYSWSGKDYKVDPVDVFMITKSGSVRKDEIDVYTVRTLLSDMYQEEVVYEHHEQCHQIIDSLDMEKIKDIFTTANSKEIESLRATAKANRKARKTGGQKREVPPPPPDGVSAQIPKDLAAELIYEDPKRIMLFVDQPAWLQRKAINRSSKAIDYIRDPLPEAYEELVQTKITGISMIKMGQHTPERQKELKKISLEAHKGQSIQYMRALDEELKELAVSLWNGAIKYCGKNPSDKLKRIHKLKWKL